MKNILFTAIAILSISGFGIAQGPPPRGGGRPSQGPPMGQPRFPQGQPPEWIKTVDTNNNKKIERSEFDIAANVFFQNNDINSNGILENEELRRKHKMEPDRNTAPAFLFIEPNISDVTKSEFLDKANRNFIRFDVSGDGAFDRDELKSIRPPERLPMPNTAMAQFIGAEMRFGNKTVKDSPFSAETIREENKRLFDGSIVKNVSNGLIFRDSLGRTRQEQPLEFIGGFPVLSENNQPKRLVHIIDVVSGNFYSLSIENKIAFKSPFLNENPLTPPNDPKNGKRESLGSKSFEGVNAEGTRITIEIPPGQIGNDKAIFVVTERWFSPELQMVVYSKHTDPFIGEVIFKLVNIKKAEPSADLFLIPNDFKIKQPEKRRNRDD